MWTDQPSGLFSATPVHPPLSSTVSVAHPKIFQPPSEHEVSCSPLTTFRISYSLIVMRGGGGHTAGQRAHADLRSLSRNCLALSPDMYQLCCLTY
ncbi:unnamed protein product [Fusarium fujikuroi]|uniref:Uncharacterized protein n=1 Tax=Fusarium fujikuroi TaxID=5127 RepID=A0A9Q9RFB5_FUSFU|nr:unnamed protein product [Fusarium fujikuroi]